jgi:hypothetical protein
MSWVDFECESGKLFTKEQLEQFKQIVDVITIPTPTDRAKESIRRLFFNAINTAFQAGRVAGMQELHEVAKKHTCEKAPT